MKTKKITKKLSLNKKTVSNLSLDQMKEIYAGVLTFTLCSGCIMTCLICD